MVVIILVYRIYVSICYFIMENLNSFWNDRLNIKINVILLICLIDMIDFKYEWVMGRLVGNVVEKIVGLVYVGFCRLW